MPKLVLETSDANYKKAIRALCWQFGYTEEIVDDDGNIIPNPEDQEEFAKKALANYVAGLIVQMEASEASNAVLDTRHKVAQAFK